MSIEKEQEIIELEKRLADETLYNQFLQNKKQSLILQLKDLKSRMLIKKKENINLSDKQKIELRTLYERVL